MKPTTCLAALVVSCSVARFGTTQAYVGSDACAGCHTEAYDDWRQSDHRHAMAPASPESVLGDFANATFEYFGRRSRFFVRNGRYFVATDDASGATKEFEIAYALGVYPLQQYLVELPDGRLQALGIAWDARPQTEGGRRWYHLYPDAQIEAGDALHWTGAFQNWNSRCASCHTTDLTKGYSRDRDTYATRWAELGVGCEACHGPGSRHVSWARGETAIANRGFDVHVDAIWTPGPTGLEIPSERDAATLGKQVEVCAGCHSRREELRHRDVADSFFDDYGLTPLLDGLYYADGQMKEEVYVAGSFLQSKMHGNQVSCTNCHEPHGGRLRIAGNALCLQCHEAQAFETREHFFHEPGSAGAQCVSCHMPDRVYMGVDRRRDHSFRVPDPAASVAFGVPNACTQCHSDETDAWAADFLSARTGRTAPYYAHVSAIARARSNDATAAPALLDLAADDTEPAMLRAIALLESARFPSSRHVDVSAATLVSRDPLLRAAAASALSFLDPVERLRFLQPLLRDPVKSVRIAVARQLTGVPTAGLPPVLSAQGGAALSELEETLFFNADMPEAMSELGLVYAARGDLARAEDALKHARALAPRYLAAMLNLADVYRAEGRDDLSLPVLEEALQAYPDSSDANHALGLLYVRAGRVQDSVARFERAARLAPASARYALVYAVALAETGRRDEGIAVLEDAARRFPADTSILDALRNFSAQ